jgi:hypothetical protein
MSRMKSLGAVIAHFVGAEANKGAQALQTAKRSAAVSAGSAAVRELFR